MGCFGGFDSTTRLTFERMVWETRMATLAKEERWPKLTRRDQKDTYTKDKRHKNIQ